MEGSSWTLHFLLAAAGLSLAGAASWDYYMKHNIGIYHWHDLYPVCAGRQQSPIHIHPEIAKEMSSLNTLTLTGYDTVPTTASTMENNGHTIQVTVNQNAQMSSGGLPGTFKLLQYHLHWGSGNNNGSEHWIDNKHYAAEIHFVHMNTKYTDIKDALANSDGLAVLGVMIEVGGSDNPGYQNLISKVPSIQYKGSAPATLSLFKLDDLLPNNRSVFYRYDGSLTTPPCSEVVTWTLYESPVKISNAQITTLRTQLSEFTATDAQNPNNTYPMYDNHRLPMDLFDRSIWVNKKDAPPAPPAPAPVPCAAQACTATVWMVFTLITLLFLHFKQQ